MKALIILFLLIRVTSFAQTITLNYDIDTTGAIYDIKETLTLFTEFLKAENDVAGSQYWNQQEIKKYGKESYFLPEHELDFGNADFLSVVKSAEIIVLSIQEHKGYSKLTIPPSTGKKFYDMGGSTAYFYKNYYKIQAILKFPNYNERENIQYIFHIYAGYKDKQLKLYNALPINTKLYLSTYNAGYINFHYSAGFRFNAKRAKALNDYYVYLCDTFSVKKDTLHYYLAYGSEELNKIKGFDFIIGVNSEELPVGKSYPKEKLIFYTHEYNVHELIHAVVNPKYTNAHNWFLEGLATYYGGSRGHHLNWHLRRMYNHLYKNETIDFTSISALHDIDEHTGYCYAMGGFLIQVAMHKGGIELIKKLLASGKTEQNFEQALQEHLQIEKQDLNTFFIDKINSYGPIFWR